MHPAPSVILFTTLSGAGFGLLVFLGLGFPEVAGFVAFVFFAIAFALACGGLMASTFHLGRPERAWKAFRQWRTSWLSREGICAVAALLVMGLYAIGMIFLGTRWALLGVAGSVLSLLTVLTTAMIYTQLKSVPRWNSPMTPLMFLSSMLSGGALLAGQVSVAVPFLAVAGLAPTAVRNPSMLTLAANATGTIHAAGPACASASAPDKPRRFPLFPGNICTNFRVQN